MSHLSGFVAQGVWPVQTSLRGCASDGVYKESCVYGLEEIKDETILLLARSRILCARAGTRAGFCGCPFRQSCGGWGAEDTGVAGGNGGARWVGSKRPAGGVVSHEARAADSRTCPGDA